MEKFEEIVPAAKLQANVAIESLDGSDVFGVADMEMLDANLVVTPRGNPLNNFSQNVLDVCASQSLWVLNWSFPEQLILTHQLSQTQHWQQHAWERLCKTEV
jgi:hypothetical protein